MFKVLNVHMLPQGLSGATLRDMRIYRIYDNPQARNLYMTAQWKDSISERNSLYEKMGSYELVDESPKESALNGLKDTFNMAIQEIKGWYFPNGDK